MIKQGENEEVEVYYEHISQLTNCFQHQTNDSLLTTFFWVGLHPYLWVATLRMKRDTLFEHKIDEITCEESMGNANEYQIVGTTN